MAFTVGCGRPAASPYACTACSAMPTEGESAAAVRGVTARTQSATTLTTSMVLGTRISTVARADTAANGTDQAPGRHRRQGPAQMNSWPPGVAGVLAFIQSATREGGP